MVEIFTGVALAAELVGVLPPAVQVTPTQTPDRNLPVIDKGGTWSPTDDLDVVVHRGPKTNVRLPEGSESDVLRLPVAVMPRRHQGEQRITAIAAGLPQLDCMGAEVIVDRAGCLLLQVLVRENVRRDQAFQEAGEPGVSCLERTEVLEKPLGRPVLLIAIAEDMLLDEVLQRHRPRPVQQQRAELVEGKVRSLDHPEAIQQMKEAVMVLGEIREMQGARQFTVSLLGDAGRCALFPQQVFELLAERRADREGEVLLL
ncbi:hypothetical protein OG578_51275 [Streptomyces canus]|nr:hypothetical protein [Streptomyces canus]